MKLFKKIRKGFTLIELVVVIAVIAILSAVAVVSYISITNKAKQSSDEQAVRQMNTALKASSILGAKDITELFDALAEEGMDAKNYKPLMKDRFFFWVQEDNQIVYAEYKNGQYVGLYPEAYKGKTKGEDHHWFSLSKEIKTVSVDAVPGGAYTNVESAEQLYTILSDTSKYNPTSITLKENAVVDMMGAEVKFSNVTTLDGNNATLENVSQLQHESFQDSQGEKKNTGLFDEIKTAETITIKDLSLKNSVVGSKDIGSVGILVGKVSNASAKVVVDNVKIDGCTVYGAQKAGLLVGYLDKGQLEIDSDVVITNSKVSTLYGEAGQLVGAAGSGSITNNMTSWGVTLEALPADGKVELSATLGDYIKVNGTQKDLSSGHIVTSKEDAHCYYYNTSTKTYDLTKWDHTCFRYFHKDAIFTIVGAAKTVSYNGKTCVSSTTGAREITVSGYTDAKIEGTIPVIPSMLG